jgi:hypothetical protein
MAEKFWIDDPAEMARVQDRLDAAREKSGVAQMAQPFFSQNDVKYRCTCCSVGGRGRRVVITLDARGNERYTCPETKITMTLVGCRPLPYTNPRTGHTEYRNADTYMAGHLILPG